MQTTLWHRGGFPGSFLTPTNARSIAWREAFIDTHLQRDLPLLSVSALSMKHYLDTLTNTFMIRQLQPYAGNLKKRFIKSLKIYRRDRGRLHTLLFAGSADALLGHPIISALWEDWVIGQALASCEPQASASFFRTAAGAEIDL